MRKSTGIVAAVFGICAGIAGLEHGVFEIMQGNIKSASLVFASMGAPCVPEVSWCACEPAMSVISNMLISGILTVFLGLLIIIWSAGFLHRRNGGLILIILSIALLLFGGGFFPPVFGITGGILAFWINKPLYGNPYGSLIRISAALWPWPLIVFLGWSIGQFIIGYYYNDFLKGIMPAVMPLFMLMLPFTIFTGYAKDIRRQAEEKSVLKK